MMDKPQPAETKPSVETPAPPPAPRRAPGHRGTDARDTLAEMALRAQEISQEAGSKIAQAMKDVINAAAGLAGFAVESARDVVQYMVRRGQMTQEEADRIIREAEEAYSSRKPPAKAAPAPTLVAEAPARMPAAKKPKAPAKVAKPKAKPAAKKTAPVARAKAHTKSAAAKKKK